MARYALVVGISEYKYSENLPKLSKPRQDAEAVAQILEEHRDWRVKLLIDNEATGERFAKELETLLTQQAVNQEALIYFTGHGMTGDTPKHNPLEQRKNKGFLTTYDSSVKGTENNWTITDGISFQSIIDRINSHSLSSLIMIIDACHSGSLIREIEQDFRIFNNNTNYFILASCQSYQQAEAEIDAEHSIFTGVLLKSLDRKQVDKYGIITATSVFQFVSSELQRETQQPTHLGGGIDLPVVIYSNVMLL